MIMREFYLLLRARTLFKDNKIVANGVGRVLKFKP
jgi:hypothetical protein